MASYLSVSQEDTVHSSKVDLFNGLIAKHEQTQAENPFSDNFSSLSGSSSTASKSDSICKPKAKLVYDEKLKLMVNQEDKSYGVTTNEKSFKRGVKANNHVSNEVRELCHIIAHCGKKSSDAPDALVSVRFKTVFNIYTKISNKVVGLLLRARKHGYVDFKGEVLFQTRDDDVIITLLKMPE